MDRTTPSRVHGHPAFTTPLLVLIGLGLLALDPVASAAQSEVRGEILEKGTDIHLGFAELFFIDLELTIAGHTQADSLGTFVIELDPGEYQLFVTRRGCQAISVGLVEVTENADLTLNIEVTPDLVRDPPSGDLRIDPASGTVGQARIVVLVGQEEGRKWVAHLDELRARGCVR